MILKKLGNKRILLIDDDPGMLRALGKVFAGEGALVSWTDSAREALDILYKPESKFDVVITDLRMPHMKGVLTGLTLVYAIRAIFPVVPIIVLTAYGSPDVKAQCLSHGAAAFLEKPLDSQQLLSVVENVCLGGIRTQ